MDNAQHNSGVTGVPTLHYLTHFEVYWNVCYPKAVWDVLGLQPAIRHSFRKLLGNNIAATGGIYKETNDPR